MPSCVPSSKAFMRSACALPALLGSRHEEDLPHLHLPARSGGAFARPRQRLLHVGAFQYPETADMFLRLEVRSIGDEDGTIGLCSQRFRGAETAREFPDAGSNQLFVERVDLAAH